MKAELIYLPRESWEPCPLIATFDPAQVPAAIEFQEASLRWLSSLRPEETEADCPCHLTFFSITQASESQVEFLCEWVCRHCLPRYVRFLQAEFPGLREVRVGFDLPADEETAIESELEFAAIEPGEVELEDGSCVELSPFQIAVRCVTPTQFRRFAEATDYLTTSEKDGIYVDNDYWTNGATVGLTKKELSRCDVGCVSYLDAVAYCQWAGGRLPSEAEWLHASLMTKEEMSERRYDNAIQDFHKHCRIRLASCEWVRGAAPPGHAVARSGPRWAKTTDWKERISRHRFLCAVEDYDIMTSFRVVKDGSGR